MPNKYLHSGGFLTSNFIQMRAMQPVHVHAQKSERPGQWWLRVPADKSSEYAYGFTFAKKVEKNQTLGLPTSRIFKQATMV